MIELKISDAGSAWTFRMGDLGRVTIGRAETNNIQIREGRSSRTHCQIERQPDGAYKLVDLESRNGTKVNGDTVNSRVLQAGDRIQIGDAVIQFGEKAAEPAPVPAARPVPAKAPEAKAPEARAPEPARPDLDLDGAGEEPVQTMRLDKRPTHRSPVPAGPKQGHVPWEIFAVAGGLLLFIAAGTLVYNGLAAKDRRENLFKAAAASAEGIDQETEAGVRLQRLKESIEKYEQVALLYPDSEQAGKAREALKTLKADHANLKRWFDLFSVVARSRQSVGAGQITLEQIVEWDGRLQEVQEKCPFDLMALQAKLERESLAREAEEAGKRLVDKQRSDLAVSLASEDYAHVLLKWEVFRDQVSRTPSTVKAVDAEIEAVKAKAAASYDAVTAQVDGLLDQGRFSEAQSLLDRARERLLGTEAHGRVMMKIQVVSLMAKEGKTRGKAEETVNASKQSFLSSAQAETFAKRREFDKAIQAYRDILSAEKAPEVLEEFGRRVEELSAVKTLHDRFIEKAGGGSLKGTTWALGAGSSVLLAGADHDWVVFDLSEGRGNTRKRWKEFSDEEFCRLLEIVSGGPEDLFTLASFCFRTGQVDRGEEILVRVSEQAPALMDRVNALLGRARGEAVPAGGYVSFKGRWMSRADRERAEEDARIEEAVQTILKEPVGEISGAVGRLSAMPRGRPALAKALRDKREILKANLSKGIRFDNATLIKLKAELDARRAEALDFIEDEARYPDRKKMEAEGRLGEYMKIQKEQVDARVDAVKEIWENPFTAAIKLNPAAGNLNVDLKKVNEWLAREDKTFDAKKADAVDADYLASLAKNKLNIQTFTLDNQEQKLVAYNLAVMEWNEKNKTATGEERAQVRITNEYRMMLGRRAVKIEDCLVRAARGHSDYMTKSGKFAHVIEGEPEGATPGERCKTAGYPGSNVSENISYNHTDPMGTFVAWYNSSGHHRNMINRNWSVLGAGFSGPHWTQNFGSQDTTKDSPNGGGWPGTDWRGGKAKRKDG